MSDEQPPAATAPQVAEPKDAPISPAPAGAAPAVEPARAPAQRVDVGSVDADEVNIAQRQVFLQYFADAQRSAISKRLSSRDGWAIAAERHQEISSLFVGDDDEIGVLCQRLRERRVVVLTGEADSGKTTLALHLAACLARSEAQLGSPWIMPIPDRLAGIDLRTIARRGTHTKNRLILFPDALSRGNIDLQQTFQRTDQLGWDDLSRSLVERNAFLVFTASTGEATPWRERLKEFALEHSVGTLPNQLLAAGLEKRLRFIEEQRPADAPRVAALRKETSQLLGTFRRMPQLARFVEYYVSQTDQGLGVTEALRRSTSSARGLLRNLAADPEAWCMGVTLALAADESEGAAGIPFVYVDGLRRLVSSAVRKEQRLAAGTDADGATGSRLVDVLEPDQVLFERCRAEIVRDISSASDVVRFQDAIIARSFWEAALNDHRRTLLTLLTPLRFAAENASESTGFRACAARAIGRLGEIDAARIIGPTLDEWVAGKDRSSRALIGPLFEGIFSSTDPRYREAMIARVRAFANQDEDKNEGLLIALAAYGRIGIFDLTLAMDGLHAIASELAPTLDDAQRLARLLERIEADLAKREQASQTIHLAAYHSLLQSLTFRVFAERLGVLLGLQHCLVKFSLAHDPIDVIKHLRRWIETGGASIGVLIGLLFVQEGGLAASLSEHEGESDSDSLDAASPLVLSLASHEEAVRQLVAFLADLHEHVSISFILPAASQRYFLESLSEHLRVFIKDAIRNDAYFPVAAKFLVLLSTIRGGQLADFTHQLLSSRVFVDDPKMRDLAAAVRFRQLRGA
jgi:energy-coupling factor transporter ATP-binding protein EcfA2